MHIVIVGLNHKTAPVEVRERLTFSGQGLLDALGALKTRPEVAEGALLSTCNRTEIYAVVPQLHQGVEAITHFLAAGRGIGADDLRSHLYVYHGREAVTHLFTVATGLDSMILGETQILGQVKDAYLAGADAGSLGKVLHALFNQALAVGKRGHTETGISQNAVSVSYATVELAKRVFDRLDGRKVLVIGAGETSELTAKHLLAAGAGQIIVANRTPEKARELAERYHGLAVPFADVQQWLAVVDVVISSTGAPHVVLRREAVQEAMRIRRGKPIFLFDIAVPRDIDPEAGRLDGVFLYDIDDLESVVQANLRERKKEAKKVERIIEEEVYKFESWLRTLDVVPLIKSLRAKVDSIRRAELEKAMARMPDLTDRQRGIIEAMTATLVNKILNDPTLRIKEFANDDRAPVFLEAVSQLFNLEIEEEFAEAAQPAPEEELGKGSRPVAR